MAVTIKDIAKVVGKNIATVSRALNNLPGVSEDLRAEILGVADKLNYRPNSLAQGLVLKKTRNIGLVILSDKSISHPYYSEVIKGIESACGRIGYNLQLSSVGKEPYRQDEGILQLNLVRERHVDGLIIFVPTAEEKTLLTLREREISFVLINDWLPGKKFNTVRLDFYNGMYKLTEYLIKLGHTRIGLMGAKNCGRGEVEKENGYRKALEAYGLEIKENFIFQGNYIKTKVQKITNKVIKSAGKKITAIIAADDYMAAWVMNELRKEGYKVPEDISVAGFNDMPVATAIYPQLTTVRAPMWESGEKAMELLSKVINEEEIVESDIILEGKIVVRDSCSKLS
ncbi:LacI family DNA-binding transcriptional regulator [bacterium]|nr:LacI family DNA-binding transcriptional regulator [bacterium]